MVKPGDSTGDCTRCDAETTAIGYGHSVYGVICPNCDLIELMPTQEVTGGKAYDPDDD